MFFGEIDYNELFAVSALVNAITSVTIGIVIAMSGKRSRNISIFVFYMFAVTIWSVGYYFWMRATTVGDARFWVNILNIGSAFIPISYFHWVSLVAHAERRYVIRMGYFVATLFSLATFFPLYVKGFDHVGHFALWPQAGFLYTGFVIFYAACSVFGVAIAVRFARNKVNTSTERKSAYFLLSVLALGFLAGTNFPQWYGIPFIPFGNLLIFLHVLSLGYAMMQYDLMGMKGVTARLAITLVIVATFMNIIIADTLPQVFLRLLAFIVLAFFSYNFLLTYNNAERSGDEVRKLAKRLTDANWELARSNEQLRVIDQRKSEFVSIVSHQLRTPITAIKGYTSLLLEDAYGPLTAEQKPQVEKVFISSNRLAQMVNDFLDISKIEQGTMKYDFAPADITQMLTELLGEFTPVADKKGLTLDLHLPEDGPCEAVVDAGKLRQIFSNLIDNAIKYTPEGNVMISLERNPDSKELVCKIKDSGVGLSQDDIHHLFGKFARGSQGQKQNTDGSGLGLYVAKKMLEAMHGKIWVDSEGVGKGSTFAIVLSCGGETNAVEVVT